MNAFWKNYIKYLRKSTKFYNKNKHFFDISAEAM